MIMWVGASREEEEGESVGDIDDRKAAAWEGRWERILIKMGGGGGGIFGQEGERRVGGNGQENLFGCCR